MLYAYRIRLQGNTYRYGVGQGSRQTVKSVTGKLSSAAWQNFENNTQHRYRKPSATKGRRYFFIQKVSPMNRRCERPFIEPTYNK